MWRWSCLLLVAGLLVVSSSTVEAGKKKRSSLEMLRQRNASERWQKLQEQWRLLPGDKADAAPADSSIPSAADASPGTETTTSGEPVRPRKASDSKSPFVLPTREPVSVSPEPAQAEDTVAAEKTAADDSWILKPLKSQSRRQKATARPTETIPPRAARHQPSKRKGTQLVNLNQIPLDPDERSRMKMAGIDDARPKPITDILPYHDYSPAGDNPCDVLCPRPADCPEEEFINPCPELVELPDVPFESRAFADAHVFWEASNLFSNPLYFEDAPLERYGHTHGPFVQPFVSVGKFGAQLVGLPYQMALHPVHERRYALGWYRPGECAPYKYYLPPWNTKAALTAGAAYTGLFFLIP